MFDIGRLELDEDQVIVSLGSDMCDREGDMLGSVERVLLADDRSRVTALVIRPVDKQDWPRIVPIAAVVRPLQRGDGAPHLKLGDDSSWPHDFEKAAHLRGSTDPDVAYPPMPSNELERAVALFLPTGFSQLDLAAKIVDDLPKGGIEVRPGDRIEADHYKVGEITALVVRTGTGEVTDVLARHRPLLGSHVARIPAEHIIAAHPGHLTIDVSRHKLTDFDLVKA